jgi:hypothetical protein
MAGDRVDEAVALREFRQRYRKSEVIFKEAPAVRCVSLIVGGCCSQFGKMKLNRLDWLFGIREIFSVRCGWWMTPHGQVLPQLLRTTPS